MYMILDLASRDMILYKQALGLHDYSSVYSSVVSSVCSSIDSSVNLSYFSELIDKC